MHNYSEWESDILELRWGTSYNSAIGNLTHTKKETLVFVEQWKVYYINSLAQAEEMKVRSPTILYTQINFNLVKKNIESFDIKKMQECVSEPWPEELKTQLKKDDFILCTRLYKPPDNMESLTQIIGKIALIYEPSLFLIKKGTSIDAKIRIPLQDETQDVDEFFRLRIEFFTEHESFDIGIAELEDIFPEQYGELVFFNKPNNKLYIQSISGTYQEIAFDTSVTDLLQNLRYQPTQQEGLYIVKYNNSLDSFLEKGGQHLPEGVVSLKNYAGKCLREKFGKQSTTQILNTAQAVCLFVRGNNTQWGMADYFIIPRYNKWFNQQAEASAGYIAWAVLSLISFLLLLPTLAVEWTLLLIGFTGALLVKGVTLFNDRCSFPERKIAYKTTCQQSLDLFLGLSDKHSAISRSILLRIVTQPIALFLQFILYYFFIPCTTPILLLFHIFKMEECELWDRIREIIKITFSFSMLLHENILLFVILPITLSLVVLTQIGNKIIESCMLCSISEENATTPQPSSPTVSY